MPEEVKTDELDEIIEWLGETVRQTDSSLLDEWEALTDPESVARVAAAMAAGEAMAPPRPITTNARAFTVMVRNAMFQKVKLAARDDVEANHDFAIVATVDLDASDEAGEAVVRTTSFGSA